MSGGRFLVLALGVVLLLVVAVGLSTLGGDREPAAPDAVPETAGGGGDAERQPDAVPESAGEHVLVGRVLRFGAGTPVAGAKVTVRELPADSDEEGRFSLGPLPAGAATLLVEAEGFAKLEREIVISASGADLGDIELRSSTVLAGEVVDEEGKPVPGAVVTVLERNTYRIGGWYSGPEEDQFRMGIEVLDEGADPPGISTGTGEDGKFRFEGLSAGKYFATARAPGKTAGEIEEVELPAEGEASVRIQIGPAVAISGTVVDIRRSPVAGARVMGCAWSRATDLPYTAMLLTAAGPDGRFRLDHLANGVEYLLFARAPDGKIGVGIRVEAPTDEAEIQVGPRFALAGSVLDAETGEPIAGARLFTLLGYATSEEDGGYKLKGVVKSTFFRYVWITREGYENDEHTIDLGSSILGGPVLHQDFKLTKLRPGKLLATARTLSGQPLEGVTITVTDWEKRKVRAQGTTGPNGRADIDGVPPGGNVAVAKKEGHVWVQPWERDGRSGAQISDQTWIRLEPAGEARVEFLLAPTAAVSGRVRSAAGKPLPGARLACGGEVSTTTNEKGEFTLDGLPKDSSTYVFVSKDGYVDTNQLIATGTGVPVEIVLEPAAIVAGRILDEEGRPLARVRVAIQTENFSTDDHTEADGKFRFGGLRPGTYSLVADREGFAPHRLPPMALSASQVVDDIEIRLPVGVEARIEPLLPDGSLADARVVIFGPMDGPEGERVTASQARLGTEEAVVFRVRPGLYRIIATAFGNDQDVGAAEIERVIDGSEVIRVTLAGTAKRILIRPVMVPGGIPRGMNLKRTEPAVPDVAFWLWGDEVWSESDGLMKSPPLPDGKYRLGVYVQDGENGRWRFEELRDVEPGGDAVTLDFTK